MIVRSISAQTTLNKGDIAVVALNANTNPCYGLPGDDFVYLVAFKDITNGTEIDLTDNGWGREFASFFGTTEGTYQFMRTGGTIPAGTIFRFHFTNDKNLVPSLNLGWSFNYFTGPLTSLNIAVAGSSGQNGDQLFILQNGDWTNTNPSVNHYGTYSGDFLYAFNTKEEWSAMPGVNTSYDSMLPSELECFSLKQADMAYSYLYYTGPSTATNYSEWWYRIHALQNWTYALDCSNFQSGFTITEMPIDESIVSLEYCEGESIDPLESYSVDSSDSHQWYQSTTSVYDLSNPINNATDNTYYPDSSLVGTFYYFAVITRTNGCSFYTRIFEVTQNTVNTSNIQPN